MPSLNVNIKVSELHVHVHFHEEDQDAVVNKIKDLSEKVEDVSSDLAAEVPKTK